MLHVISHTPVWVFVLFVVLFIFGFLQTRGREVKLAVSFLLPVGMIILSFLGVISSFGFKFLPVAFWTAGALIISFLGYKYFPIKNVTYNHEKASFSIPGSWISFFVVMAIFFTKYSVAVMHATSVSMVNDSLFILVLCLAYGSFSGFFVSRAVCLLVAKKLRFMQGA